MESIVHLNNINCNGCVNSVKQCLSDINGIDGINVDIPTGKVTISHNDNVELDQMLELLDEAGYPEK